jgi:1-acyl-sn-glycerol-3-phosphate acyltransferase
MGRQIRSFLFDALFYLSSAVIMLVFLPMLLLPKAAAFWAGRVWVRTIMGLLKSIVGLSYRVEGLEHLPKDVGYIVASKHESAWETLIFHLLVPHPSFALKQELMWIPIMNLYFRRMGTVSIRRGTGASALKSLIQGARRVMAENRPLIIFPEGTRAVSGKPGEYQVGVAALYRDLNVSVIPVALNSGLFWGRRSPVKHPGQITLRFLPPIQPGLSRADFMTQLVDSIEGACAQLNKEAA